MQYLSIVIISIFAGLITNSLATTDDDVDLFTGKASYNHPLYTLSGRGGMDVDLTLRYSSGTIEDMVWARNDKAPTSRFGLGWGVGFGTIVCAHKNTVDINDDDYGWIVSDGSMNLIVKKVAVDGTVSFMIKKHPYWRVTRHTMDVGTSPNNYSVVTGWTIVDENGRIFTYGDISKPPVNKSDKRDATEYTFAWGQSGYVGDGTAANPELYPYRWDIAKSADQNGNTISYHYEQKTEGLWNSTLEYTKCSYLKRITNPEGAYILFETQPKKNGEFYDPYTMEKEPDGFQEFMDTTLMKTVSIYSETNKLLRKFDFCYIRIREIVKDKIGKNFFVKSLLKEVVESNQARVLSRYVFDYYDDETAAKKDPVNYNFGALKSIQNNACGKLTYVYKRQDLPGDLKNFNKLVEPKSLGEDFERVAGLTNDGSEFIVISDYDKVYLYQWNGYKWLTMKIGNYQSGSDLGFNDVYKEVFAGLNYFVINVYVGTYCGQKKVMAFNWNGASWVQTLNDDYSSICPQKIYPSAKYFLIHDENNNVLKTYYWDNLNWIKGTANIYGNFAFGHLVLSTVFFAYRPADNSSNASNMYVFTWNGRTNQFEETNYTIATSNGNLSKATVRSLNNTILSYQDKSVHLRTWDGVTWKNTYTRDDNRDIKAYIDNGYLSLIRDNNKLMLLQWNGKEWNTTYKIEDLMQGELSEPYHGPDAEAFLGQDFLHVAYPRVIWRWGWQLLGIGWIDYYRYASIRSLNFFDNSWNQTYEGQFGSSSESKRFRNGTNYSVVLGGQHKNGGLKKSYSPKYPIIYDGSTWKKENVQIKGKSFSDISDVNAGVKFDSWDLCYPLSENSVIGGNESEIDIYRKINGSFAGTVNTYVVNKTILSDAVTGQDVITNYVFNSKNSTFDTRGCIPKFNKAELSTTGAGKTVYYFYNGYNSVDYNEQYTLNPDYEKLDGIVYRTEQYNDNGKLLNKYENFHSIFHNSVWPEGIDDIRLTKTITTVAGMISTKETTEFDNANGLPTTISTTGSDGKKIIESRTYAFRHFQGMGPVGANILTPLCQDIFYEGQQDNTHVRRGQTITWDNTKYSGKWVKNKTFAWKNQNSFQTYWDNPNAWQPIQENSQYDSYGNLLATTIPATNVKNAIILGSKGTLPSAGVSNADYNECAILTGDYDDNPGVDSYFDDANKWSKGGTYLTTDKKHFGTTSIKMSADCQGVSTKINGINPDKDYLFTAWVYTETNSDQNHYISLSFEKSPSTLPVPEEVKFTNLANGSSSSVGWQMIKAVISEKYLKGLDPAKISGTDNYLKVKLSGVSISFYVDDIRFCPKDAMVSTYYYDPLWKKVIAEVDPNGSVSSVKYDDEGRLSLTYDNKGRELSKMEYRNAQCDTKIGDGKLSLLQVKAGSKIDRLDTEDPDRVYTLNYDNNVENVIVSASVKHEDGRIRYRINGGEWIEQVCPCQLDIPLSLLSGEEKKVEIQGVAPSGNEDDNALYTLYIKRNANCWAILGNTVSLSKIKECRTIVNSQQSPLAIYTEQNGNLKAKIYQQNDWVTLPQIAEDANGIQAAIDGDNPIVCYIDLNNNERAAVKKYTNSNWTAISGSDIYVSPTNAQYPSCAVNSSGTSYVAYVGDLNKEAGYSGQNADERLIIKRENSDGTWISATGNNASLAVSTESARDVTLKFSPTGDLYIAYIAMDTDKDNTQNDEDGKVIVKRLQGNQWVQIGDFVSGPAGGCNQLSLTFYNNQPCIAYAEPMLTIRDGNQTYLNTGFQDVKVKVFDPNKSWLPPFRSDIPANYSHWVHLGPQSIFRLSGDDAFQLNSKGSNLCLLFQNIDNEHMLTVLKWNGTEWRSLINPGFADCDPQNSSSTISISVTDSKLYASYPNGNHEGLVNVSSFDLNQGCSDATICNLQVAGSSTSLEPAFKQYILNYNLEVENSVNAISFNATPCTQGTVIKTIVNNKVTTSPVQLNVGQNIIVFQATSADGSTRTFYTVNVKRKASAYASLCTFKVYSESTINSKNEIAYSPAFDPTVLEYNISGNYNDNYIYILPINDGKSTIYINNVATSSENITEAIPVNYGTNRFEISVVAPDGVTKKTYYLNVTKPVPSNSGLTGLIPITGTLQPAFSTQIFEYTITVPYTTTDIQFTPTANSAITITNGNKVILSGQLTGKFPLIMGQNDAITFVANQGNGSKGTAYHITVTRQPAPDVQLSNLVIYDDYQNPQTVILSPTFSANNLDYTATVPFTVKGIRITPTAAITSSVIEISGGISAVTSGSEYFYPLEEGLNLVVISVTNGVNTVSYNLDIKRESNSISTVSDISFEQSKIDVNESDGTILIPVTLNKAVSSQVSIGYKINGGSASNGSDYTLTQGNLVFDKCTQTQYIQISIIDDKIPESNETVILKLENATPAGIVQIAGSGEIECTIHDDDFQSVSFDTDKSSVSENAGNCLVSISLAGPTVKPVTVHYDVYDLTTKYGEDYSISKRSITFNPGDPLTKTIPVAINEDEKIEGDESFRIELLEAENGNLGTNVNHTVTILDDDTRTIQFATATGSGLESQANPSIMVTVDSPLPEGNIVSIQYSVTGGTATRGTDYILTNGTLTFSSSTPLSQKIPITIINNEIGEGNETIIITLSDPTGGALLGTPKEFTYTIVDARTKVIFVDKNAPGPVHDGKSWNTAYLHPQFALSDPDNDVEIWVARGVYQSFSGADDVLKIQKTGNYQLFGGFIGNASGGYETNKENRNWRNNQTVFDGEGNKRFIDAMTDNMVLDGFFLQNGGHPDDEQSAIFACNATIQNCEIKNNHYGFSLTSGKINDCHIVDNNIGWARQGLNHALIFLMRNVIVSNCYFEHNSNVQNGGVIDVIYGQSSIVNCTFIDNSAEQTGGAIYISTGNQIDIAKPSIVNCVFVNNRAEYGGAISSVNGLLNAHSEPVITNCVFQQNTAVIGGAIWSAPAINSLNVNNSIFVDNIADPEYGNSIYAACVLNIKKSMFEPASIVSLYGSTCDNSAGDCIYENPYFGTNYTPNNPN